jgi:hypothetical protein
VQDLACGSVSGEQAVGRPGAPVAAIPVRREVLLVREDRVGSEEVGGSHEAKQNTDRKSAYCFLSTTPEELAKDTDTPVADGGELDAEFVATLTKAHGALAGENARIAEELAAAKLKLKQLGDEQQKLSQQNSDLQLSLDREERSRATAESEKRATEVREAELVRQVSALKTERFTLTVDLDATRRQVAVVQAAHTKAVEAANRNYAIAKDLEQRLSAAKGVATATGLFGLAMFVGNVLSDDTPAPRGGNRRRRA